MSTRAEQVSQAIDENMCGGLWVAGGLVMSTVCGVPIIGLEIGDNDIVEDFRFDDICSKLPFGVALPLVTVAGHAAMQSEYWPECQRLVERDRRRFARMASLEFLDFEVGQARSILKHHIRPMVQIGGMLAVKRYYPFFIEWDHPHLAWLRKILDGIDGSKGLESFSVVRLDS
jgi:hypothetical protein